MKLGAKLQIKPGASVAVLGLPDGVESDLPGLFRVSRAKQMWSVVGPALPTCAVRRLLTKVRESLTTRWLIRFVASTAW